jgi:hypothetical protein
MPEVPRDCAIRAGNVTGKHVLTFRKARTKVTASRLPPCRKRGETTGSWLPPRAFFFQLATNSSFVATFSATPNVLGATLAKVSGRRPSATASVAFGFFAVTGCPARESSSTICSTCNGPPAARRTSMTCAAKTLALVRRDPAMIEGSFASPVLPLFAHNFFVTEIHSRRCSARTRMSWSSFSALARAVLRSVVLSFSFIAH